jgi:predicted SnoaL-like aldol condensation-catalyzing enzyme
MSKAPEIHDFIQALKHNSKAEVPPGFDPVLAELVRDLVLDDERLAPSEETLGHIWQQIVLDASRNSTSISAVSNQKHLRVKKRYNGFVKFRVPKFSSGYLRWTTAIVLGMLTVVLMVLTVPHSTEINNEWLKPNEQYAAVFQNYIDECWNEGRIEKISEMLSTDYVQHTPGMPTVEGRDEMAQSIQQFLTTFPDAQFQIESINVDEDRVEAWVRINVTYHHSITLPDGTILTSMDSPITYRNRLAVRMVDNGPMPQIAETWIESEGIGFWLQMNLPTTETGDTPTQAQQIETIFQLDRLIAQTARRDADFIALVDPSLTFHVTMRDETTIEGTYADFVQGDWDSEALVDETARVEHVFARGNLVAVQMLVRESSPGGFVWSERITLYRFDGGRVVEMWRFWFQQFELDKLS